MDPRILLIFVTLLATIIPPGLTEGWFRRAQAHHREKLCGPKAPHPPEANPLLVETENGKVFGARSVSRGGKEFVQFLGIPFAQPPVGKLRFESPKPIGKWDGVLNATKYGPACAQYDFFVARKSIGVEDCLHLNVLTPLNRSDDKLLPVFVYIHGGAFHIGASHDYKGDYFMDHDIVFVSANYRLGALGFLNTNDGLIRGNMGMKDQVLALQWIQKNIRQFGGDPDLVTISGTSAGAISVNHHIFSPKSKGLFSKAVIMSGNNLTPYGIMRSPKESADRFISKVNCTAGSRADEVTCLKNLDTSQLLAGHGDILIPLPPPFELFFSASKEVIQDDDTFLAEDPLDTLNSGNFSKVPVIMGIAEFELQALTALYSGIPTESARARDNFNEWAPEKLDYRKDDNISDEIKQFYYHGNTTDVTAGEKARQTSILFSDRMFITGLDKFAKLYSAHAPVFLYYNAWNPEPNMALANLMSTSHKNWTGNSHGDDVILLFEQAHAKLDKGSRIYNLSQDLVELWTQFCNEEWMSFRGVPWWQNNPIGKNVTFLKIDDVPALVQDPFKERMDFWEGIEKKIKNP